MSPASSEDKIRSLYEDVSAAVEDNVVADATGRNALYKIHVSLGKIVNQLDAQVGAEGILRRSVSVSHSVSTSARRSVAGSVVGDDEEESTVLAPETVKEEDVEDDDDGDTVVQMGEGESLVEELLTDEES